VASPPAALRVAVGPLPLTGGVKTHISGLARNSRHRISLIRYSPWSPFFPGFPGIGSALHRNPRLPRWDPYGFGYRELVLRWFDVVHTHAHPVWPAAYEDPRGPGRIHTVHQVYDRDDATDERHWRLLRNLNEEMVRVCRRVDRVVAVSRALADLLSERYSLDAIVIPNGIDFSPPPAEEGDLPAGVPDRGYVLFVGHLGPVKRPDLVLRLAAALPDRPFVMVGPGLQRSALEARFGTLPPNLIALGPLDNAHVRRMMRHAHLVVQTSVRESASIVVLEALAERTRVVAPALPCNRELFAPDLALFEVGDFGALLDLTLRTWDMPSPTLGSLDRFRSRHDIRAVTRQVDELYEEVSEGSPRTP